MSNALACQLKLTRSLPSKQNCWFGIGANNSKKVYDALGANAVEKIQENPYVLVDIVYGVNFHNIDNKNLLCPFE